MSQTYLTWLRKQYKVKVDRFSSSYSKQELPKDVNRIVVASFEQFGEKMERVLYIEGENSLVADLIEKVKAAPEKKEEVKPRATRKPTVKSSAKPKPKPKTTPKKPTQAKPKEDKDGDKDVASK